MALSISAFSTTALGAPQMLPPVGVESVVTAAMTAIARVHVTGINTDPAGKQNLFAKTGTAFLVSHDGYLVTNCHTVKVEKEKPIGPVKMTIEFADNGERLPVSVRGCDEMADLAVLHLSHPAGHRIPLRFAQPNSIALGQAVVAIGYPQNLDGQPSVVDGIISGLNRNANCMFRDLIQTNALVSEGNSGGPLLNLRGEIVGVVTYRHATVAGIAYARSSNTAAPYVQLLVQHGEIPRADFGFTALCIPHIMQEQWDLPQSVIMIEKISPQSPGQRCGLSPGDLIYALDLSDRRTLHTSDVGNLHDALALVKPGDIVKINFLRMTERGAQFAKSANRVPPSELKRFYATCTAPRPPVSGLFEAGSPG
jgi:S1-C subfamily serine protease